LLILPSCIANPIQVQAELDGLGLDAATLAHLRSLSGQEAPPGRRGSAFQYSFDGSFLSLYFNSTTDSRSGTEKPIPKLTLFVQFENGIAVDAALTPGTRKYLQTLAHKDTPGDSLKGSPEIETQFSVSSGDK
jgi:E3 ubiquitin-protein ligase BAH